jgi:hypothetical protein
LAKLFDAAPRRAASATGPKDQVFDVESSLVAANSKQRDSITV